jgi:RimJ/RimL family protein N-acetyltransferase
MTLTVREMTAAETDLIVEYFLHSTPEHLEMLGVDPGRRHQGVGAECVWRSVDLYFDRLKLKRLFCEPHAFNVAPNRTLQKAGFKYLKTHMTVPGPFNFHQAVTRWVIER